MWQFDKPKWILSSLQKTFPSEMRIKLNSSLSFSSNNAAMIEDACKEPPIMAEWIGVDKLKPNTQKAQFMIL